MHQMGCGRSSAEQSLTSYLVRASVQVVCTLLSYVCAHLHVYVYMSNIPLPLQLAYLYLGGNSLEGTLPESWSNLTNVSLCHNSLYLRIDVHGVPSANS